MKVAVFGAGTMGSGIAQVFAAKGHTALMYASSVASAQRHKDKLAASLQKRVEKGKMTEEAKDAILNNILVEEKSAAADADLVIVVGSRNSSNSVRLVEVALEAGAKAAHRVDNAGEVDPAWLEGVEKVGVTSGASVPDELVQGVLAFLEEQGYPAAVEERLTEENLVFALPPELRRDLKRA